MYRPTVHLDKHSYVEIRRHTEQGHDVPAVAIRVRFYTLQHYSQCLEQYYILVGITYAKPFFSPFRVRSLRSAAAFTELRKIYAYKTY